VKRVVAAAIALALGAVPGYAQLSPISGSPLPQSRLVVPFPAEGAGSVRIVLPASFGVRDPVPAHHGTEVYKLPVWSVVCPQPGRKRRTSLRVNGVTNLERNGMIQTLQTVYGSHEYPLACRLGAIPGRFTIVFYDPGHPRSPALTFRGPDYVVP
jgi:hypothetical protein